MDSIHGAIINPIPPGKALCGDSERKCCLIAGSMNKQSDELLDHFFNQ